MKPHSTSTPAVHTKGENTTTKHTTAKADDKGTAKPSETKAPAPPAPTKAVDKGSQAPADLEDSRHDRATREIGTIVDDLLAILRAELDTDRLQGAPRNAVTNTIERLIAAKTNLGA